MSDVWQGTDTEAEVDPWMTWVPILLYAIGAFYVLTGTIGVGMVGLAAFALFGAAPPSNNPQDPYVVGGMLAFEGIFLLLFSLGIAAVNFAGGWGFKRGRKWAWFVALVLGAMYTPSACFPFGIALLYGCINEKTRNRFLAPKPTESPSA